MSWKSGSTKQTSTYKPPSWVEDASKSALAKATEYSNKPYEDYSTASRFAPLTGNENQAYDRAAAGDPNIQGDMAASRAAIQQGQRRFTEADMGAYMNPYIKGALDPAARELEKRIASSRNDLASSQSSRGAFSGSRAVLADREMAAAGDQQMSDLWGKGYANAFESASDKWYKDQQNQFTASDHFMRSAGLGSDLIDADTRRLMGTGQIKRSVEQSMKDFDYGKFIENRDWGVKQASVMIDALRGIKGSYTEQNVTKSVSNPSGLSTVLGAVSTIAGLAQPMGGQSAAGSQLLSGGNAMLSGGPALGGAVGGGAAMSSGMGSASMFGGAGTAGVGAGAGTGGSMLVEAGALLA